MLSTLRDCYFINDDGQLCLAESFADADGKVETKVTVAE
jgi:hypothetical protein